MPKFSIAISVFNKEKYISNTIKSVLNQTFNDFEIVILNDGSTDNSESEILAFKDPRIKYFSEENQGAGAGRNYIINKATGEYIALLDADDIWYSFYLEEQNELIKKYPEEVVFSTSQEVLRNNQVYPRIYKTLLKEGESGILDYFKSSKQDSIIHSSSVVIRKDFFNKVGGFNPNIKSGQDTDLWIRIGLKRKVVFSTKICTKYIYIPNSLFRSTNSISQKIDLSPYESFEKNNNDLKVFLDLNRYSLALQAKVWRENGISKKIISKIDKNNLNWKQKLLLKCNRNTLVFLKNTQGFLKKWFRASAFS